MSTQQIATKRKVFAPPHQPERLNPFSGESADLGELEFSEFGRDPRVLPGWWIAPAAFVGFAILVIGIFV
jgi:hypothetical protein